MLKKIFIVIVIIAAGYAGFLAYSSYYFQNSMRETLRTMNSTPFSCPEGTTLKTERWGFLGYSRYCTIGNQKIGLWEAWEGQHLVIKGNYQRNLQHGVWIWIEKDGSTSQKIQYSEGREVSKAVTDSKK